jgi:hypothetical protein
LYQRILPRRFDGEPRAEPDSRRGKHGADRQRNADRPRTDRELDGLPE